MSSRMRTKVLAAGLASALLAAGALVTATMRNTAGSPSVSTPAQRMLSPGIEDDGLDRHRAVVPVVRRAGAQQVTVYEH